MLLFLAYLNSLAFASGNVANECARRLSTSRVFGHQLHSIPHLFSRGQNFGARAMRQRCRGEGVDAMGFLPAVSSTKRRLPMPSFVIHGQRKALMYAYTRGIGRP
jgi:hypothetical protein